MAASRSNQSLLAHALPAARKLAALKRRAVAARIPVVYANDNSGRWRSDFRAIYERATAPDSLGKEVATLLAPDDEDYFVLKPKHSAFYASTLEVLLEHFGARCVIIAGFAGDMCVRFTAHDAFLRGLDVVLATDCIASEDAKANRAAIADMTKLLRARALTSGRIDFRALRQGR
jgi:nicotinamidase-related amidase